MLSTEWIHDGIVDVIVHSGSPSGQTMPQRTHDDYACLCQEKSGKVHHQHTSIPGPPKWLVRLEINIQSKDSPKLLYFSDHIAEPKQ
jgi:hypothetical protein